MRRFSRALTVDPPPGCWPPPTHHHHLPFAQRQRALLLHMVAHAVTHGALSRRCVALCVMWLHNFPVLTCRAHCKHNPQGYKGYVYVCVLPAHTRSQTVSLILSPYLSILLPVFFFLVSSCWSVIPYLSVCLHHVSLVS